MGLGFAEVIRLLPSFHKEEYSAEGIHDALDQGKNVFTGVRALSGTY